jgi:DNA-binding MarR family transcriptional regulator
LQRKAYRCRIANRSGRKRIPLKRPESKNRGDGRFAYEGLDRVIHAPARLSVLTSLITHPQGLTFTELKELCALTDGNLSRHLQILETAGLVAAFKAVQNNRSVTVCRVTADGRKRYIDYLQVLERVVLDVEAAVGGGSTTRNGHEPA